MSPPILLAVFAATVCASLAFLVLVRRPAVRLARPLFYIQLGGALFCAGELGSMLVAGRPGSHYYWLALSYLGLLATPPFWWQLVWRMGTAERGPSVSPSSPRASRWPERIPIAISGLCWIAVATNPWHGLVLEARIGSRSEYLWLWFVIGFWTYGLIFASVVRSFRLLNRARGRLRRRQLWIVATAPLPILGANLWYVFAPEPLPVDITMIGLVIACGLIAYGMLGQGLFGIAPLAFSQVFENDPDGLLFVDENAMPVFVNGSLFRLLGVDRRALRDGLSLLSQTLTDVDGTELTRERLEDRIQRSTERAQGEICRPRSDPKRRLRLEIQSLEGSRSLGGVTFFRLRDITELEQAKDVAAGQSAVLDSVLGGSEDGLALVSQEHGLYYANKPFGELWRLDDPPMGLDAWSWFHQVAPSLINAAGIQREFERIAEQPFAPTEVVGELRDGRFINARSHPIVVDGRVTGRVWSFRDVTAERRAHERLLARSSRLQAQQSALVELAKTSAVPGVDIAQQLQRITETCAQLFSIRRVGIWQFDDQRSVLRCADLYDNQVGHSQGVELASVEFPRYFEALEQNRVIAADSAHTHPATGEFADNYLVEHDIRSMLDAPIRVGGELRGVVCIEAVGESRNWEIDDQMLAGSIADTVALALETSERKRAEAAILHAQKLESLGVLAGGIAHDFNNLLVSILGNASLALERHPDSRCHKLLSEIATSAERASELTDRLLAYAGRSQRELEEVHLPELIEETIELLKGSIISNKSLETHFENDLPALEADPAQIRQIVMNLLVNASDAIEGAGTIRVSCRLEQIHRQRAKGSHLHRMSPGPHVVLEVRDNGLGMDEATRAKIFDPFFTTKFTGRGLGLAAVLGIVEGHRGAITVDSRPGQGTTFRVYLPASDQKPPRDSAKTQQRTLPEGSEILVVDDEETVRQVTLEMLASRGLESVGVDSGERALELVALQPSRFDAVVLDLTMAGMGGEQTAVQLRRLSPQLAIILSSGFPSQELRDRLRDSGIGSFLQKPYSTGRLFDAIAEAIELETNKLAK